MREPDDDTADDRRRQAKDQSPKQSEWEASRQQRGRFPGAQSIHGCYERAAHEADARDHRDAHDTATESGQGAVVHRAPNVKHFIVLSPSDNR